MTIHEKPLCKSEKIYRGTCEMRGCNNTWESTTRNRKYCQTEECNKNVQNMNNDKHRKRNSGKLPPVQHKEKIMADNIREHIELQRNQSFLCAPLRKIRELF